MNIFAAHRKAGFTLIELLISIFIFSVVVTSVYGAYRATFHTVKGTEKQISLASEARVIFERITADLESIFAGDGGSLIGVRGDIDGNRGDSFSCTSSAHLIFHRNEMRAGLTVLNYSVEEDESGSINLYRSDRPMMASENEEDEEDKGLLLGRRLRSFQITYVTANGDEQEEWDSEPADAGENGQAASIELPVLIRIELRIRESDLDEEGVVFRTAVAIPQIPSEEMEEG